MNANIAPMQTVQPETVENIRSRQRGKPARITGVRPDPES